LYFLFHLVVMQPHTIINQTLHSYCKEQFEFNIQPMYINLTEYDILYNDHFMILYFFIDGRRDLFMHAIHIRNSV
jgi:hypothetical protein